MSEESGRGKSMKGLVACFHDFGKPWKAFLLAELSSLFCLGFL